MSTAERDLIEKNDLTLLHTWFDDNKALGEIKTDLQYPSFPAEAKEDLWTKVIAVLEQDLKQQGDRVYVEVSNSSFARDSKIWWLSLLALMKDAPLEELEKYSRGSHRMPERVSAECISVAARIITGYVADKKRYELEKERISQEMRLRELENEAEEKQNAMTEAENNLQRHRNQRNQQ